MDKLRHILEIHWAHGILVLLVLGAANGLFAAGVRFLKRDNHPLARSLQFMRQTLFPTAALVYILLFILDYSTEAKAIKILETLLWIEVIWVVLSLVSLLFYGRVSSTTWKPRVPELFLDLVRFSCAAVGASLVIAGVWNRDLGGLLATLGLGSIVLGLALQDTLGNLFAGIALLFERPYHEGDWIKVGDTIGEVLEMNWRSVRLRPRSLDMVVVPNSIMGKERIHNFSRPTSTHGTEISVSFSYNDPPNAVKHVLLKTLEHTRGALRNPHPVVRTLGFRDSSIEYQVRFFIEDYYRLPDIQEEFLTQVWYAARRNKLTFAFPTRTIFKTELPAFEQKSQVDDKREILSKVSLFQGLESFELDALARDAIVQEFARGERILHQGDSGDALYIVRAGSVVISISETAGTEHEITRLGPGKFFGEMALLTGEKRSANVTALEDLEVLVVYKEALGNLFSARPNLAQEISHLVIKRQEELDAAAQANRELAASQKDSAPAESQLLSRIKSFFGI